MKIDDDDDDYSDKEVSVKLCIVAAAEADIFPRFRSVTLSKEFKTVLSIMAMIFTKYVFSISSLQLLFIQ